MKKLTSTSFSIVAALALVSQATGGVNLDDPNPVSMSQPVESWAPMLGKGTQELTLSGQFDWDGFEDLDYNFRLGYGWFVVDGWEFGLTGSAADQNDSRNFSAGFFTEYNFNRQGQFVPFIGLSAEWANLDVDVSEFSLSQDSILLGGQIGVKYFFRPNIAISTALTYSWAADDIFDAADTFENNKSSFLVGIRVYF
ncbi:MAG: hypothetical protein ACI9R3_003152 [Verrucomicrobiales bacterium]|jgi:hypothetical protein